MEIRQLDWNATAGQTVRIYRNLNNGTMSIQAKSGKSWLVMGHVTNAIVRDVTFKVSESGRQRVIRDKRKNVHAWGQGVLLSEFDESIIAPIALGYNPYTDATFVDKKSHRSIDRCDFLVIRDNQVFVSPDALRTGKPLATVANLVPLFDRMMWQPAWVAA